MTRRTLSVDRRPRARVGLAGLTALCFLLPACQDGHLCVLGYTTEPNYDTNVHTVRVPIFKNLTLWRGLEFDLTKAVVREIETKTPYKVVSQAGCADTELTGTILSLNKTLINRDPYNEVREAETTLAVEIVWKDLRTGEILSRPRAPGQVFPATPGMPSTVGQPGGPEPAVLPPLPPPGPPGAPPPPVLVQSIGGFIPELGGSITTAAKQNVDRLAIQIVSMMEKPW